MTTQRVQIALIGDPVAHSLSPALQQAAFDHAQLPYEYVTHQVTRDQLPVMFNELKEQYAGLNVTIPLKEVVVPLLDEVSQEAKAAGSVNTVTFASDSQLSCGFSTDGAGLLAAIKRVHADQVGRAVVLGTGGAARAVAAALAEVTSVTVAGRNSATGERLARDLQDAGRKVTFIPAESEPGTFRTLLDGCDLVVNATPLGGPGYPDRSPLPDGVVPSPDTVVFDLIYLPRITPFLRDSAAAHCKTIEGIEMLIEQGALAFTHWTGIPAPVDVMRQAAYRAADNQAGSKVTV
jgi:shikimate dehydrogenase